jgi:hydroxymethylbilane synthase
MQNNKIIRLGSRGSALARWQTEYISELLLQKWPEFETEISIFSTRGDRILDTPLPLIGGKGLFTSEIEAALRNRSIDIAVHSLKDLPVDDPEGLVIGAIPQRENPADVLVSRSGYQLDTLPDGATVGSSSRRRAAQLLACRPDLNIIDLRGNVDTRIRKALDPDGPYDAVVLAFAGVARLDQLDKVTQVIPLDILLPAPAQGALGIQSRDEPEILNLLNPLIHMDSQISAQVERSFLAELGGGCSVPVAAYAHCEKGRLIFIGRVISLDGSQSIQVEGELDFSEQDSPHHFARKMAKEALDRGAKQILESIP